jgi:HPr kinase/phosphorylase
MVAKSLDMPAYFVQRANECSVPVLRTPMSTTPFIHQLTSYLDAMFSPQTNLHGSLVDVYGVGLLFTGRSAIGKSETALDLVERGHRLVADDVVTITRRHGDILIGTGNQLLRHHMEIRGLGIIDVQAVFGIRSSACRSASRCKSSRVARRRGLRPHRAGPHQAEILGVSILRWSSPSCRQERTVIAEVIALDYLLKAMATTRREVERTLMEMMKGAARPNLVRERIDATSTPHHPRRSRRLAPPDGERHWAAPGVEAISKGPVAR